MTPIKVLDGDARSEVIRDPDLLRIMWSLTGNRLRSPPLVSEAARTCHLSERSFRRRFLAATGLRWRQFLLTWRLETARVRLEATRWPVSRIADQVGYASTASFSRAFSRRFGTPPTEARRP